MSETRFRLRDGTVIDVTVRGQGPAVVLLHGWTAAARDWEPVLGQITERFRCIAWNARPHAVTDDPGIDSMAEDLAELLEAYAGDGALVCGHSMGALTVLEYLARYGTRRLRGVALIDQSPRLLAGPDWPANSHAGFTQADNNRFLAELRADFAGATVDLVARSRLPASGGPGPGIDPSFLAARHRRLRRLDPAPWIRCWESFIDRDYRCVLPDVDVPALLVFGGRSRYYRPAVAARMHRDLPDARLAVYEGAGHGPHVEQPQRFARDLLALAASADQRSRPSET